VTTLNHQTRHINIPKIKPLLTICTALQKLFSLLPQNFGK